MEVVIVGAGIGGLTAAGLLSQRGHAVTLVEKSSAFGDVGAGIQIAPNGSRLLAALGLAEPLADIGTTADRVVYRRWQDDRELMSTPIGTTHLERYGHPYFNVFRPDLIDVLCLALGDVDVRLGTTVVDARSGEAGAVVTTEDGEEITGDVVVAADGIHSAVRAAVFGELPGRFSGWLAYRALVPREHVPDLPIEITNRLGPGRHLVSYFVGHEQRYLNLVCVVPEATWDVESWTEPGRLDELQAEFADWAPGTQRLLGSVAEPVYKWALYDREPLGRWACGRITLLGDACHPMVPFMAQGANMAIEDGAVLARCLDDAASPTEALARYERTRRPRTARMQAGSWRNCTTFHLPDGPEQQARDEGYAAVSGATADALARFDAVQGYDALSVPLE